MNHKKRNIIIIVTVVVIIVIIVLFEWAFRKAPDSVASQKAVFEMEAKSLVNSFVQDEQASDKKYLGKVILVAGTLESFTVNGKDKKVSVIIKDQGDMAGVICEFGMGSIDTLSLKVGNKLKVKGECNGFLMDVVLNKCSIVE